MHRILALAFAGLTLSCAAFAAPPSQQYKLAPLSADATLVAPRVDRVKALRDDLAAPKGRPLRYAIASKHDADARDAKGRSNAGVWETLPDGRVAWRLAVHGPGALTLDFGFDRMFLPRGAELYVTSVDGKTVLGPYTEADNTRAGSFWTPYVEGEVALIEAVMPAAARPHFVLELGTVHSGYRDLFTVADPFAKSLNCNIDTACPDADPYRDQVRAIALITFSGSACTGQLINNTAGNARRLLSTANHCLSTQARASSLVAYWRYESPTCRAPGSSASGAVLPRPTPHTGGSTLLATHPGTDATLVELATPIPTSAQPYFLGWDRRLTVPSSTAIIHQPAGDEKRISLDFNPPRINTAAVTIDGINLVANGSFDVTYDRGTTEGGSSGGALLSNERRFIGQLAGGAPASCTTGITDSFGRFALSWEGGGAPTSRFRDHLDPGNTSAQTLEGKELCTAPTLVLNGPATVRAGEAAAFSVTATGGQGPYTIAWDIDGDGTTDRTTTGTSNAISPVYPSAGSVNVIARVTDAANCPAQAQRALVVTAPVVTASHSEPVQVCGDGDGAIEPGERFRIPVTLSNTGTQPMQSGFAVFARDTGTAGTAYVRTDNTSGATCPFQFVDIGASALLPLTPSDSGFPATDDGRTSALALQGGSFFLFGEEVRSVVMSTNGYLSNSPNDSGGDYDNACPIDTPDRGSEGARFNVLHDDLAVLAGGGLRSQYFANCPRPADSAAGGADCTVFQWNNLARVTGGGDDRDGNFTMQAILYDDTGQIVYQYASADPQSGASATIGIQNAANTVRDQYGCNESRIAAGRAVCFFDPNALPAALQPARTRLLTPAVSLGNLGANQAATIDAVFEVDRNAACGSSLALDYVGAVDDVAHALDGRRRVLATSVGGGAACQTFNGTCVAGPASFAKRDGLYSSLVRFGNGMGAFNLPQPGGRTIFGGQWYTGKRDRTPEWLILQGDIEDNQADVPVYRFRQTGTNPFTVASTIVGRAQISYTSPTDYVATWTVDGVAAGEKLTLLYGTNRPAPNRTGSWFPPSESGWGLAIDDHFLPNGQAEQVIVNYFYDAGSNPVWTLGGGPVTGGTQPHNLFRVHCPSCPSLPDMLNDVRPAGTVTANYTGVSNGTYSTAITFPPPVTGSWNRTNVPIQMISPPQSPAASDSSGVSRDDRGTRAAPPAAAPARASRGRANRRTHEVIR